MRIDYDTKKIQTALFKFTKATGINAAFIKSDFTSLLNSVFKHPFSQGYCQHIQLSKNGQYKCFSSDKELLLKCAKSRKPETHMCHAGLIDVAIPIVFEENIAGFLLLGQMKETKPFEEIKELIKELPIDLTVLEKLYKEIPVFDPEKINSIVSIAEMLAKYLLVENSLFSTYDFYLDTAVDYINNNLQNQLTVEKISKASGVSKNTLYDGFMKEFNMTVGNYITKKRIQKAEKLLLETKLSVEEISLQTGFSTSSYFAAVFKKANGISPLKFRNAK